MRILIALTLVTIAASASAAEIASIDFDRIKSPLTVLVLTKPENAELKQKYAELGPEDPMRFMEGMDFSTDDTGAFSFDLDPEAMSKMMKEALAPNGRYVIEQEIEELLLRELVLVIDGLDESYGVIIRASGRYGMGESPILYSSVEIVDITQKIFQVIVRALPGKPDRHDQTQ